MQKIVCTLELNAEEQQAFKAAAGENEIIFARDTDGNLVLELNDALIEDADALLGYMDPQTVSRAPKLKWVQTKSSGVDDFLAPGILRDGVMLTSATGAYGQAVAEHMFAMMFGIMKKLPQYRDKQREGVWSNLGGVRSPKGETILIFGTGDLGSEFAKYCKAFGAHTVGVRRNKAKPADYIDEMHGMDELDELITKADVIISLIPHSDDMVNYFNYDRFMSMKRDAIFLNAGRGTVVDSYGLVKAMDEGNLWGAGLDTVNPEPLPADHPIYRSERIFLTPHSAGDNHLPATLRNVAGIALGNLKAYLAGEPLKNRKK